MVKESIIMTVSDREPEILLNTLRWLAMCPKEHTEIILVNDCSRLDYEWMKPYIKECGARMVDLEPYECYQIPEINFNNPAKAFNRALLEANGERVAIMSSDVLLPPTVLETARKYDVSEGIYCPRVIDLATATEYCGPSRMFPMPWFIYADLAQCCEAGGWDENYLTGLCFEDNDFVGRLALVSGGVVFDWNSVVWHQSHEQPAYNIDNEWISQANRRNQDYTQEKWGGIPFAGADKLAFSMDRERHETGNYFIRCKDVNNILQDVIAKTRSPFMEARDGLAKGKAERPEEEEAGGGEPGAEAVEPAATAPEA